LALREIVGGATIPTLAGEQTPQSMPAIPTAGPTGLSHKVGASKLRGPDPLLYPSPMPQGHPVAVPLYLALPSPKGFA